MTRLLNTPIIGPSAKTVASSWIDMLAGLSGLYIFKTPPCFWAHATSAVNITRNNEPAAANPRRFRLISVRLPWLLRGRLVPYFVGNPNQTFHPTPVTPEPFPAPRQKCRSEFTIDRSKRQDGGLRTARKFTFAPQSITAPMT